MTGLWFCTNSWRGVELLQLQLLQVPAEYDLLADHGVSADTAPLSIPQCPKGVLLQSVLNTPAPAPAMYLPWAAAGATSCANQAALAPAAEASANSSSHQLEEGQQVLLVGTKLLAGDIKVPAGWVLFAVDMSSRSTAGAGERFVLPTGTSSDVDLDQPGTRELRIKVSIECWAAAGCTC